MVLNSILLSAGGLYKTQDEIKSWAFNTEQGKKLIEEGRKACIEYIGSNITEAAHLAAPFCECVDNNLIKGLSNDKSIKWCANYFNRLL